jgi:phosphatidylglycerophosphate synthase
MARFLVFKISNPILVVISTCKWNLLLIMSSICDFTIYSLIPIGLVYGNPNPDRWLLVSLLLGAYFVNSASLFQLAAILEKKKLKNEGKLTTIVMPDAGGTALIEGTETMFFYTLFLLFPNFQEPLFGLFALLVLITTLQRLIWAAKYLS